MPRPVQKRKRRPRRKLNFEKFQKALEGREVTRDERLKWVEQNRLRPAESIQANEPPDLATVDLWELAQDDDFWKSIFKTHTTKDAKETKSDIADDGRALTILDNIEKEFYAKRAEQP